jgi:hypothetical protein
MLNLVACKVTARPLKVKGGKNSLAKERNEFDGRPSNSKLI